MCVLIFSAALSQTILTIKRNQPDTINILRSSCKIPVINVRFKWNFNFLNIFSKDAEISNFMKIRPVEEESFHGDVQIDIRKLIAAVRNSANTPNKSPQTCNFMPLLALQPNLSISLQYTADLHTTHLTWHGLCDRHCDLLRAGQPRNMGSVSFND